METFSCKTTIISGQGALSALSGLHIRRLFLVTDPFFAKNGTAERVAALTQAAEVCLFDQVEPDPSVTLTAQGTARLREFAPDTVVALGGGSALDLGKAVAWFSGQQPRVIAVPTTSGSGSELTDFAILTHDRVKHPLVDSGLQPDYAILDEDLLRELPRSLIADAGFDVLSHAAEAIAAKQASPFTDALAKQAFADCYTALPASYAGDRTVRLSVHLAASMAGLSFNQSGLGLCHALSHSLGGLFHVPHGRLNAVLLPAVIACNAPQVGAKYAALARAAGLDGSSDTVAVRNLRSGLIRLRRTLSLPATLAEAGIAPQTLWRSSSELIRAALADPCAASNPVAPTEALLRRILEEAAGHG